MSQAGLGAKRSRIGLVGVVLGLGMALALGAIRLVGEKALVHAAEWWIGDLALAALVAAPALLALLALRGREVLYLPAGVLNLALSVTFLSGAGLPLLIPGVLYLLAYARAPAVDRRRAPVAIAVPMILVAAAFVVLLIGSYQIVCWHEVRYADGRTELFRDRAAERASRHGRVSQTSLPPRSDVVQEEGGCTEGGIKPLRSVLSLVAVAGAVAAGWRFA